MNAPPTQGAPPLGRLLKIAVTTGAEGAVRLHIARGDDLNARDDKGMTPLMIAASRNKVAICKLLLDAGADSGLLDSAGNDAISIATAAGAHDAAAVIATALPSGPKTNGSSGEASETANDPPATSIVDNARRAFSLPDGLFDIHDDKFDRNGRPFSQPVPNSFQTAKALGELAFEHTPVSADEQTATTALNGDRPDDAGFDLTGWDAEEDRPPPEDDGTLAKVATTVNDTITNHTPIDSAEDWNNFDTFLPERAAPLPSSEDFEDKTELRRLLLRAVREGSVPDADVADLTVNDDRTTNEATESLLRLVINDLGAETDERLEYSSEAESFEVFVNPEETAAEETSVSDALAFLEHLESRRTDPLRLHMREMRRERLISAEEEVALAKAMEDGMEMALDALANWPSGIARVLTATELVKTAQKPLTWISSGSRNKSRSDSAQFDDEATVDANVAPTDAYGESDDAVAEDDSQYDGEVDTPDTEILGLLEKIADVWSSSSLLIQNEVDSAALRDALVAVSFKRSFLLELSDATVNDNSAPATQYAQAIQAYQRARERLVLANLRLVLSIARRYVDNGLPLDDLVQEGYIGLLKAVDKFDWRRGYKFSTMATWWIRQQITRSIGDTSRLIRLPVHVHETLQRVNREASALEKTSGRYPSAQLISERLSMPLSRVEALLRVTAELVPVEEFEALDPVDDAIDSNPFEKVAAQQLRRTLDKMLAELGQKPEKVMRLRFGLGGFDALTLEEVGALFEVTRERIRQIEAKALGQLKHRTRQDRLRPWFYEDPTKEDTPKINGKTSSAKDIDVPPLLLVPPENITEPAQAAAQADERVEGSGSHEMNPVLADALALGVVVEDDGKTGPGSMVVNLTEATDDRRRLLALKLIAMGFDYRRPQGDRR